MNELNETYEYSEGVVILLERVNGKNTLYYYFSFLKASKASRTS